MLLIGNVLNTPQCWSLSVVPCTDGLEASSHPVRPSLLLGAALGLGVVVRITRGMANRLWGKSLKVAKLKIA